MPTKRQLIHGVGFASASLVTGVCAPAILASHASAREGKGARKKVEQIAAGSKEEVSPPEDLMREHGVLDRVLLCYEAALAKFSANEDFDPALVAKSAEIIRDCINNYHERSKEDHVKMWSRSPSIVLLDASGVQAFQFGSGLRVSVKSRRSGESQNNWELHHHGEALAWRSRGPRPDCAAPAGEVTMPCDS
jgi:hypothetical protein